MVDIVADDATRFEACYPPTDFYCPPHEVIAVEARRTHRGHFNVIHHDSGFKADITSSCGKLEYHREGGSQKHLDDIAGILNAVGSVVDAALVEKHEARLGLDEAWRALRAQLTSTKT